MIETCRRDTLARMGRLLLIACLATIASPALAQQAPVVVVVEPSPPVTSASVVTGAIVLGPPVASAPATWGVQVPPESFEQRQPEPETRSITNWPLVGSGIAALAGGWALGWLTTFVWNLASTTCHSVPGTFYSGLSCTVAGPYGAGDWQMAIPLVGPWLTFTTGTNTFRGNDIAFPVFIGILEPVGLILMIIGLTSPIERRPRTASIEVTPGLGSLSIHGTF